MRALGAGIILFGDDFNTAKTGAKRVVKENNFRFAEDSNDVETLEGTGTIAFELLKFTGPID
jgi:threonine dehydratase